MTTRLDTTFNFHNQLVVEVSQVEGGWELGVPGIDVPLWCRRLTDAKAVLYDSPRGGAGAEPTLDLFNDGPSILLFREGASEIAGVGDQVLVTSSTWPGDLEVVLTHDVRAQDRELSIFTILHQPGFTAEEKQRSVSIDRAQIDWLSVVLGKAGKRLQDRVTGDWEQEYFSW